MFFYKKEKFDIKQINFKSKSYPLLLKQIYDKPEKLYMIGKWPPPETLPIAIVGTRRYTQYGRKLAQEIAGKIAKMDIPIVSGFAMGIDRFAHEEAIKNSTYTIAVIAGGLHHIGPQFNADLIEKVLENGCFLSEHEPDVQPNYKYFPIRNRIIAGLSQATIVIEGDEKSGALITARQAFHYDRDVFTVPGDVTRLQAKGPLKLLQQGIATPIASAEDLFKFLNIQPSLFGNNTAKMNKKFTENEKKIYETISATKPIDIDEIHSKTGISIPEIQAIISTFEIEDLIEKTPRGFVKK